MPLITGRRSRGSADGGSEISDGLDARCIEIEDPKMPSTVPAINSSREISRPSTATTVYYRLNF